jgi:hypothetical protein
MFHVWPEDLTYCALCEKPVGSEAVIEERPTGAYLRMQRWAYCPECWAWSQEAVAIGWERFREALFTQQTPVIPPREEIHGLYAQEKPVLELSPVDFFKPFGHRVKEEEEDEEEEDGPGD